MAEIIKTLSLYPIDYPFETLVDRVEKNKLILNPDFQRVYKWDKDGNERSSKFIESCLMRIPLPACYFAEDESNNHLVIDGVQRITTIKRFFNDEFALEGLTIFSELNGKKFSDLEDHKSELETTTIRCVVLRKENPKQLIQEIFARLNQGSVQLSPQEIRHAIYPGNLDNLLQELSNLPQIRSFKQGEQSTTNKNSREDEELILRFFATKGDLSDYDGNLKKYLDEFMSRNQNMNDSDIISLREIFSATLKKCIAIFEDGVFTSMRETRQQQGLVYFDLQMWGFLDMEYDFIIRHKERIKSLFSELNEDPEFTKAMSGGTQQKGSIIKRRTIWKSKLDTIND